MAVPPARDPSGELPPLVSRSGMLPPDGAHWPPVPARPAPPAPPEPVQLPATARRPEGSDVEDWRSMPFDGPDGYRGSTTAPVAVPRRDPWCVASLVLGAVGVIALWVLPVATWFACLLGVAFGLVGRRTTSADPSLLGRGMATAGVVVCAGLLVIAGLRLTFAA